MEVEKIAIVLFVGKDLWKHPSIYLLNVAKRHQYGFFLLSPFFENV